MAMNPRLMRPLAKTPPGTPASLLLRFNGADASTDFVDSSPNKLTVTANGDAQISTAQSKFGGASGAFGGGTDRLQIADASANEFLSGDFTIEYWIRLSSSNGYRFHYLSATSGQIGIYNNDGSLIVTDTLVGDHIIFNWSPTLDEWYHIALTRQSGAVKLFVNGIVCGAATSASNYAGGAFCIGGTDLSGYETFGVSGYIDDFRITKGLAVYDGDFVVPSSQSSSSVVPYTVYKPYGTFLFSECVSGDLVGTYADGVGGRYTEVISVGSC